ncbi:MAG: DMT family transporter [Anaerovoracaceae bacterium]
MSKKIGSKQLKADMMLVLVTLCWGISYLLMDIALEELEPFVLNTFRFFGAFVIASIVAFPRIKSVNKETIKYSIFVGIALYFVYIGCTFGVMYTSISNAGFLCALAVVFTPLLAFIFLKQVPNKKFIVVVIMAVIGIACLTLNEQLKLASGDILCILCAFAYAVDLLITEIAVSKDEVDAFQLGVFQLGVTGILCAITAIFIETPKVPSSGKVWFAVIFLTVFCTGIAFIIQAVAQQYTTASHVGVIFTLEPVFSGIGAFLVAGEVLSGRAYFGAFLLVASLFVMEVDFSKMLKRNRVAMK